MRLAAYIITYNEQFLLPFVLRYLQDVLIVNDIYIFDNHSTDNTVSIAKSFGCKVELYGNELLDDREYLKIKNYAWMNDRDKYDFIFVSDADELFFHPNVREYLKESKEQGISLFQTQGFNMYSNKSPDYDIREINTGFYDSNFSKKICFDPKKIEEIGYNYGCHTCKPKGQIKLETGAKVLHYRCIGGVERMISRHNMYALRMSKFNRDNRMGFHYLRTPKEIKDEFDKNLTRSNEIQLI